MPGRVARVGAISEWSAAHRHNNGCGAGPDDDPEGRRDQRPAHPQAAPVFEWLKKEMPGLMGLKRVKWNFEKFLVGRDGEVKGRWASTTKPESLKEIVEKELAAPKA